MSAESLKNYQGLLLTTKGEVKRANVQISGDTLDEADIQKYLRRKEKPDVLKQYTNADKTYSIWGYFESNINGKKGNINQSKFPTHKESTIKSSNTSPIIGDILIVAHGNELKNTYTISAQEWNDFVDGREITANVVVLPIKAKKGTAVLKSQVSAAKSAAKVKSTLNRKKGGVKKGDAGADADADADADAESNASDITDDSNLDSDNEDAQSKQPADDAVEAVEDVTEEAEEADKDADEEADEDADEDADEAEEDEDAAGGDEDAVEDNAVDAEYFVEDLDEEREIQAKRKKKSASKNTEALNLKEELTPTSPYQDVPIRANFIKTFAPIFQNLFADESKANVLENDMYCRVLQLAESKFIPKNWKSKAFMGLYKNSSQQIFWNLHPQSPILNRNLIRRINEGEFPIEHIVAMSSYELAPEKWRDMGDRQLLREQKILEGDKSRSTDQFKCHRCGKRECSFYELQTRSADEPMTQFITCLNCGKRWRQ
jgi:transcription elongation factor S-II